MTLHITYTCDNRDKGNRTQLRTAYETASDPACLSRLVFVFLQTLVPMGWGTYSRNSITSILDVVLAKCVFKKSVEANPLTL